MSNDSKHTHKILNLNNIQLLNMISLILFIFTYKYCNFENLDLGAVHHSGIRSELQLHKGAKCM